MRIAIRLSPSASGNQIDGKVQGQDGLWTIKARVTAAPDKGKANAALIELLARTWHIRRSAITLIMGAADRRKLIELDDDVVNCVQAWLNDKA